MLPPRSATNKMTRGERNRKWGKRRREVRSTRDNSQMWRHADMVFVACDVVLALAAAEDGHGETGQPPKSRSLCFPMSRPSTSTVPERRSPKRSSRLRTALSRSRSRSRRRAEAGVLQYDAGDTRRQAKSRRCSSTYPNEPRRGLALEALNSTSTETLCMRFSGRPRRRERGIIKLRQ